MAPPPAYGGGMAGGGFGGANMMRPAVMPEGWNRPVPAVMPGGGMPQPVFEGMATGGGYGPGPINQFGGAQQFGPGSGLLGNIMGGGMQQAVMPEGWDQQGPPLSATPGAPAMGQPGIGQPGMAEPQPQYDPGVSAGRLAEAQRLAGLGQMGRAKQQWELGGGTWGGDAHRFLRG